MKRANLPICWFYGLKVAASGRKKKVERIVGLESKIGNGKCAQKTKQQTVVYIANKK